MEKRIATELNLRLAQVKAVLQLTEDGGTIPFIARYRKEQTGELDEVEIKAILDRHKSITQLETKREDVLRKIEEQGVMTPELKQSLNAATTLQQIEDLYLPFRPKRRTKAEIAREAGLAPFADFLRSPKSYDDEQFNQFIAAHEEGEAVAGAQAIIAEEWGEQASVRDHIRKTAYRFADIVTKLKKDAVDEKRVFAQYYEYNERIRQIVPHRILAINRAESLKIVSVKVVLDDQHVLPYLLRPFSRLADEKRRLVEEAVQTGYKKSVFPAIERELRNELTDKAENQAIEVFGKNLRQLYMQPPMKGKVMLGLDPAYRTGCKWAVIDPTGEVKEVGVVYVTMSEQKAQEARQVLTKLVKRYGVELIAIGNGTASRETESFVANWIKEHDDIAFTIVDEAGASIYSASEIARTEFPDLQVEQRSAISIARRLQDPLAELVKVDPQSVGVGQYQHDVTQTKLKETLDFVVETVVNQVGVDVNTASESLLGYVAGITKATAKKIVERRSELGAFESRKELLKVPRLGAKAYEQAAGFLRIPEGSHPLDRTPIHPEQYKTVERLFKQLDLSLQTVGTEELRTRLDGLSVQETAQLLEVGEPTLRDIIEALQRPERDPREALDKPLLRQDVLSLDMIQVGMEFQGTVRNVLDFGAFVDIGVKESGLVHISKLSKKRVKHPLDVIAVGDIVTVWVTSVEPERGRIGLTMVSPS
ncbi:MULTISPECIES: Tex family protein [Exiguobacterium]|uniref:Tex family protein n=1 Tax=Exiguobacterium antarcticum TaxID=132920 RepID=A0ABT6R2Q4_9BACL|nr:MULTISPECIES: Tex family protein [Exiguobacterium]MCT4781374.1 RNA-binding transcriptional accessory protein [Exiguobacterium soli]MDI3235098.1 Tex family protein [Exiguobacterium antarcticum]